MAWLVSFSFSTPLSAPQTLIQDTYLRRSVSRRLLYPTTCRTVVKVIGHKCSDRGIFPVDKSCHHHITAARSHFSEPFFYHFNVSSSTSTVISGFWVGPDIEDGWGFIEALVNHIF